MTPARWVGIGALAGAAAILTLLAAALVLSALP